MLTSREDWIYLAPAAETPGEEKGVELDADSTGSTEGETGESEP